MDATFESLGRRPQVTVEDNQGETHTITIDTTGTVHEHQTDAYSTDPADRTPAENEHVNQARQYARYALVVEDNEQQALPLTEHPGLQYTMYRTVAHAPDEQIDEILRPLAAQLESHGSQTLASPVEVPRHVSGDDLLFYRTDIWVTVSDKFAQRELQQYLRSMSEDRMHSTLGSMLTGDMMGSGIEIMLAVGDAAKEHGSDPIKMLRIGARSNIRPVVVDSDGREFESTPASQVEEPPAATLELPPMPVGTREEFRDLLAYHLLCRGRDAYLAMGIEPKEEVFKVQGPGSYEATQKYRSLEMYEDYHDPDADISSWDPQETLGA